MPILDAALAFALTMLVIATTVTTLVSLIQSALKVRRNVMKEMLDEYYQQELAPVIERELIRIKGGVDEKTGTQFKKLVAETKLFSDVELENLVEATTSEITERLKRSKLGAELMTKLKDKADAVFDAFGERYEAVGLKFTNSFRNTSRWWATGIAFLLALVINIDAFFIMDSYIQNQGLREAIIAQRDTFEQDYKDAQQLFDSQKDTITKEEFEAAFTDSQGQIDTLTSVGLPIGWSYFPHAGLMNPKSEEFTSKAGDPQAWVFWVIGILLTSGLAGLGGPFWYDTVSGISKAADVARKKRQE